MSFNSTGPTYDIGTRVVLKDKTRGKIIGVNDATDTYLFMTDQGETIDITYTEILQKAEVHNGKASSEDDPAAETKLENQVDSPLINSYQTNQSNADSDF